MKIKDNEKLQSCKIDIFRVLRNYNYCISEDTDKVLEFFNPEEQVTLIVDKVEKTFKAAKGVQLSNGMCAEYPYAVPFKVFQTIYYLFRIL